MKRRHMVAGGLILLSTMIGTPSANAANTGRKVKPQTVVNKMVNAYHNYFKKHTAGYEGVSVRCWTADKTFYTCDVYVERRGHRRKLYLPVVATALPGYHRTRVFEDGSGWVKITNKTYLAISADDFV